MGAEPFRMWLEQQYKSAGFSMRETSIKAGLSEGRVSQIMRGDEPGVDAVQKLAALFHADEAHILHLAGLIDYDPAEDLDPETAEIARRMAQLPRGAVRNRIYDAIIAMIDAAISLIPQTTDEAA